MTMKPEQVIEARELLGLSKGEFATALGLPGKNAKRNVQRWESGAIPVPPHMLAKIMVLLEVKMKELKL